MKKRTLSFLLAMSLVCSMNVQSFAAEKSAIQQHPFGYTQAQGYIASLDEIKVEIDGVQRRYYEYVAEAYKTATPVIYIFVPSGVSAQSFLETSGWKQTADENGLTLIFPVSETGVWDINGGDAAYWKKVSGVVPQKTRNHNTRVYLCGYGDGAQMAQVALLEQDQVFAGAAFIDTQDMSASVLDKFGNADSYGVKTYKDKLLLPHAMHAGDVEQNVLIYQRQGTSLTNSIAFWKKASGTSSSASVSDGKTIYTGQHNSAARVAVKAIAAGETSGKAWSDDIWNYMNQVRRFRNSPDSSLAPSYEWENNPNAHLKSLQVAGETREWVEVLPSDYSTAKKYPIVLALHGSNNDGPQMYELTRLAEVAEARDFIALFPTADRTASAYDLWDYKFETKDSNGNPDIQFIMSLLDNYKNNYSVDASRVYVTGFSNGASMTNALAMRHPELFAAAMPYSGAVPKEYYPEKQSLNIPIWMNKGTLETTAQSIGKYGEEQLNYWIANNKIDAYSASNESHDKVFITGTYAAEIPFYWTYRLDAGHAIFSENYWKIYDEFFAHCQRGPKGESIWNDEIVDAATASGTVTLNHAKRIDGKVYMNSDDLAKLGIGAAGSQIYVDESGTIFTEITSAAAAAGKTAEVKFLPGKSSVVIR